MFKVRHYKSNEEFIVYGTSRDSGGTPWLLIYTEYWTWDHAENYIPVDM